MNQVIDELTLEIGKIIREKQKQIDMMVVEAKRLQRLQRTSYIMEWVLATFVFYFMAGIIDYSVGDILFRSDRLLVLLHIATYTAIFIYLVTHID